MNQSTHHMSDATIANPLDASATEERAEQAAKHQEKAAAAEAKAKAA